MALSGAGKERKDLNPKSTSAVKFYVGPVKFLQFWSESADTVLTKNCLGNKNFIEKGC